LAKKRQLRLTRRPGKTAFWIYQKNYVTRLAFKVRRGGEPVVIQAYSKKQAISFYVRAWLKIRGPAAIKAAEDYLAVVIHGGGIGSQTELPG